MYKKLLLLLIFVIFLTGCTANVNIEIDKETVKEKVTFSNVTKSDYNSIKNSGFPATLYYDQELENPFGSTEKEAGVPYYDTVFNEETKDIEITGSFPIMKHSSSNLVRTCFYRYTVLNQDGVIQFSTAKGNMCKKNFNVVMHTEYYVPYNDADEIDEETNTYTWHFNKRNSETKGIYFEIDFTKKYNEKEEVQDNNTYNDSVKKTKKISFTTIIIIMVGLLTLLIIAIIILLNKKRKVSEV